MMLGQTAAPIGKGAAEIGVGTGFGYQMQNTPTPGSATQYTGASGFALPALEGNAQFGLGPHLGINAHFSPAGIQPGLKITVNKSYFAHFALMPQFAIGYGRVASSIFVTDMRGQVTETFPTSTTLLTFMLGLRAIASHVGGFYASVGADLIATRSVHAAAAGTDLPTADATNTVQLSMMANVGWSISLNWLRIRPEIAFAAQPWVWASSSQFGNGGGFGFAILPGFSLVALTPKAPGNDEEEKEAPPEENSEEREEN
jgi:hypothetical protein